MKTLDNFIAVACSGIRAVAQAAAAVKSPVPMLPAVGILAVAVAASPIAIAAAANAKDTGTPITAENLVDVMEIRRVASALTNAVDSQQWDVVRDILENEVDTTIGERERGVSSVKSEDEIVARWRGFYDRAETLVIHHITSNDRVFFADADNATVYSKGVIVVENTPAGEFAESGGTLRLHRWVGYEIGATRTVAGWKVNKVLVDYLAQEAVSLPAATK